MQFKRHSVFALSICALLLGACGFPVSGSPTPDPLYIEAIVQTRIAAIPTSTQPTAPIFTATATPTVTLPVPTPTLTLFYQPTVPPTPSLTECPLIVTVADTRKGDVLHVRRCEDNLEYDLPPLAKGAYAAGPNLKFIVYVTNDGFVYISKIGSPYLGLVVNLVKDRRFTAVNKKVLPNFSISFLGTEPNYTLVLFEKKYQQKYLFDLPANFTE